jgi:predicted nucleic acid-binding protein
VRALFRVVADEALREMPPPPPAGRNPHRLLALPQRAPRGRVTARRPFADDPRGCGISAPSISEFWSVVTHPASAARPSTPGEARRFLTALIEDSGLAVWLPGPGFGQRLSRLAEKLVIRGARIFDLQIALAAFDNGATEIWTHDRAFVAVPGMTVTDPL